MDLMPLTPDIAREALAELCRDLNYTGFPNVNIVVLPSQADGPPAAISSSGIYLHPCIGSEIRHIKVYLLHELYHPAVFSPGLEKYPFELVNVAEDIHINWCLLQYHGMDVRTVPVPGIYDEKLGPLHPKKIIKKLLTKKKVFKTWTHTSRVYQPQLTDIADHIRTRWMNLPDRSIMQRSLSSDNAFRNCMSTISGLHPDLGAVIDPAAVLRGCFQHCFDADPVYVAQSFDCSAQLVVGMNPPRMGTIQQDLFAEIATDIYIGNVSSWNCYIPQLVDVQQNRVFSLREKIDQEQARKKLRRKTIAKLETRLQRARKKLALYNEMAKISIPHELKNNPLTPYTRGAKAVTLFSRIDTDTVPRKVPGVRNTLLKKVLTLCSRPLRALGKISGLYDEMGNMLGSLLPVTKDRPAQKQLALVLENNLLLKKLLQIVPTFDKAFRALPKKVGLEDNAETMLGFGQDLPNVEAAELALLSHSETEVAFWNKYAEHVLLQQSPVQSRNQPVYIAIDCSSSMKNLYPQALSMAISIAKVLIAANRECTIVTFNEDVVSHVEAPGSSFSQILHLLSNYDSDGGTDIMAPLKHAFETRQRRQWKSMYVIVITDGDDVPDIKKAQTITQNRKPGDKFHLMLLKPTKGQVFGFDRVSYGSTVKSLVTLARNVL